jgi:hypothetical protein
MAITVLAQPKVKETVLRLFEDARKSKGAPVESDRFLAYLTNPPARTGRRVADTFAGRFRYVRFMESVQLEFGICFTSNEWERGASLDDFAQLVLKKESEPVSARRLAEKRLQEARMRRIADPIKFGFLTSPLLFAVMFSSSWTFRVLLALPWALVVGGVIVLVLRDVRLADRLVARIATRAGSSLT